MKFKRNWTGYQNPLFDEKIEALRVENGALWDVFNDIVSVSYTGPHQKETPIKNEILIMRDRASYNLKRRISGKKTAEELKDLASKVRYGGNPEHKRNPGDFGLTPPAMPRPDKTLCDTVGISKRNEATRLLKKGVRKGLISIKEKKGFPKNIWTISKEGHPLEAQLENQDQGVYHGYPMPENDPFRQVVLEKWRNK